MHSDNSGFTEIQACRLCGHINLTPIISLGCQALTGIFPRTRTECVDYAPLELVKCSGEAACGLVQLRHTYDLDKMYGLGYGYRSGLNSAMEKHLREKVRRIESLGILNDGDLVIDVGSNDATTLKAYTVGKYDLVGIDPTGAKFSTFYPSYIKLVPDFFSEEVARKCVGAQKAKVITSFSMFYDLPDPLAFASDVERMLADDGIWVLEQSYLPTMLSNNSFDTICHEHLEYYAFAQIEWIARRVGLTILDVEFNDVNGGSFSLILGKEACQMSTNDSAIENVLGFEHSLNLKSQKVFQEFVSRVQEQKHRMLDFLEECRDSGVKVGGLGASTKGNVLLQYYGISEDLIESIGEINPDKFGCYTPGTFIPIISEDALLQNVDILVILPWHFKSFFERNRKFSGKSLVFPLPEYRRLDLP